MNEMNPDIAFANRIEQFLRNVQDAYMESWKTCGACGVTVYNNVIRGRARCISGKVEDLLATALYEVLKDRVSNLHIFVDMPLSYDSKGCNRKGSRQKNICYPDIIISQKHDKQINVLYLLEVKVNLGWGRDKLAGDKVMPIEEEIAHRINALANTKVMSKKPIGMTQNRSLHGDEEDSLEFVISSDTKYDLILCSSKNVSSYLLNKARARISANPDKTCQLYVLSDEELSLKYLGKNKHQNMPAKLWSDDVVEWWRRIESIIRK